MIVDRCHSNRSENRPNGRTYGFALTELLLSMGIGGVVLAGLMAFSYFGATSMASLVDISEMSGQTQSFLDEFSTDVRAATNVVYLDQSWLMLNEADGDLLFYIYAPESETVYRIKNNFLDTPLQDCKTFKFSTFQRTPTNGSYEQFPVATEGTAKVIQLHWKMSRSILDRRKSKQTVYSAKFVIRNI